MQWYQYAWGTMTWVTQHEHNINTYTQYPKDQSTPPHPGECITSNRPKTTMGSQEMFSLGYHKQQYKLDYGLNREGNFGLIHDSMQWVHVYVNQHYITHNTYTVHVLYAQWNFVHRRHYKGQGMEICLHVLHTTHPLSSWTTLSCLCFNTCVSQLHRQADREIDRQTDRQIDRQAWC